MKHIQLNTSFTFFLLFLITCAYSQSPQVHLDLAQKSLDQKMKFTAEYHALISLSETHKNPDNYKELILNAFVILNDINSNFRPNFEETSANADSLKSNNQKIFKEKVLPKIKSKVFIDDDYFQFYENYLMRQYRNEDFQVVVDIYEDVYEVLSSSKSQLKINHLNHFDYVIKAYSKLNEVQKNLDILDLMQEIYENEGRKKEDNYISVYLEVGDEYSDVDINSSLRFYDIAYQRYQNLADSLDESILNEIFESQSTAQLFSGKFNEALEIELENLKTLQLTDYKYLKTKLRILNLYYKTDSKVKAHQTIQEIRESIEQLDKKKDSYSINQYELVSIVMENNDYEKAIDDLKELIEFFEKFKSEDLVAITEFKFMLCKSLYYSDQINNAKNTAESINEKYLSDENLMELNELKKNINSKHSFLDTYLGNHSIMKLALFFVFMVMMFLLLKKRK